MSHPIDVKKRAISLRERGYSIKEIASKLGISKDTSSIWLRNVVLTPKAELRLRKKEIFGQYKGRLVLLEKSIKQQSELFECATRLVSGVKSSKELSKLCCALIYFCEGNKQTGFVRFTNSDPTLVKTFMVLLRRGFDLEELKFRALMHLHQYHNEEKQRIFWSKLTGIPSSQFHKTYSKPNTGARIRDDYPGCLAISYYDSKIAKELMAIYNAFYKGVSVNW